MKNSEMKHFQSRSQSQLKANKENQPNNSCSTQPLPLPAPRKIGLEIRSRIHKTNDLVLAELPIKHNQPPRDPFPKLKKAESMSIDCDQKRVKSVSFDENERGMTASVGRSSQKKSILKKSMSSSKQLGNMKRSQISLATSHVNGQDQSIEFSVGNKVIVDKYQSLRGELRAGKRKYRDEIYPPVKNSIYLSNSLMKNFCEMFEKEDRRIEWMRLSELYKHKNMVVWTPDKSQKSTVSKGYISRSGGDGDFLANVFNIISDKPTLLQKLFESQTANPQCIYYAKVHQTQTSVWKYVLIDDYIPVVINKKLPSKEQYASENVFPAFLNVNPQGNTIELWPFLLQKALAKYYSTYDSLANGNSVDFLEEITGSFLERLNISQNLQTFQNLIKNEDVLLLLQSRKGMYVPLRNSQSLSTFVVLDRENKYKPKQVSLSEIKEQYESLHYTYLHKYYFTSRCQIQQENVKSKVKKHKDGFILRTFSLEESCQCQLATVQKEQRFYRTYLTYDYAWMRVILVQKEADGYRWITGAYDHSKTITLTASLSPGQYILIMLPEWKDKAFDFNLIFKGSASTFFQRKSYDLYPGILEESCMDIAQRCGKMVQVNKNICSYHYIERSLGLIIENVNNQKEYGSVKIVRSIEGLQNYRIRAFNEEFRGKTSAEIVIRQNGHFTVILMTSQGAERSCLDMFDFGF